MKRHKLTAFLLTISVALAGCGGTAAQGGAAPEDSAQAVQRGVTDAGGSGRISFLNRFPKTRSPQL